MDKFVGVRKAAAPRDIAKNISDGSKDGLRTTTPKSSIKRATLKSVEVKAAIHRKLRNCKESAEKTDLVEEEPQSSTRETTGECFVLDDSNEIKSRLLSSTASPVKKSPSKTMTWAEFKRDSELSKQRRDAFKNFGSSVAELIKSPEKIRESPFYSEVKESLTVNQAVNRIYADGVRKKLFPAAEDQECDGSTVMKETPPERNLPTECSPRTPIKKLSAASPSRHLSPGKRTLLYSPSKGAVHCYMKSATQLHSEHIVKDVPGAADASDAVVVKQMQSGLGKRKAEFDRDDVKRVLELTRTLSAGVKSAKERQEKLSVEVAKALGSPAHQKYEKLASVDSLTELVLPAAYQKLEQIFAVFEMTMKLLKERTCYFELLQKQVHERLKHALSLDDLGRVKAYFPHGYIFRVEKPAGHLAAPSLSSRSSAEQMTILLRDDTKPDVEEPLTRYETADQVRRRKKFHSVLVEEVADAHKKFLRSLAIPVPDVPIYCWHSNFLQDYQFRLRDPGPLPAFTARSEPVSAEELLRRNNPARSERLQQALELLRKNKAEGTLTPIKKADLKQWSLLSPELRRRAEENAAKNQARMITRDPETTKRLRLLEKLYDVSGVIWSYFTSHKMLPRPEADICKTIQISMKTALSEDDVRNHMNLFVELFGAETANGFSERRFITRSVSSGSYYWQVGDDFSLKNVKIVIEEELERVRNL